MNNFYFICISKNTNLPPLSLRALYTQLHHNTTNKFSFHFVINTAPLIPTALYLHPSFGGLLFTAECGTSANEQITRVIVEIDSEIKITRVGAHASRGLLIILGPLSQLAKLYAFRGWTVSVSDFYLRGYPRDRQKNGRPQNKKREKERPSYGLIRGPFLRRRFPNFPLYCRRKQCSSD